MTDNLEKAKKMFFDYSCSSYFMARDAADSQYKAYGATKELEAEWRKEYVDYWTFRLVLDDLEALNKLNHAWAVEALPDLQRMCSQADGYAKLQYAEVIWQLSKASTLEERIRQQARETAMGAWESLVQGNFTIPEHFQKNIKSMMAPINATTPEQYVVDRAKKGLEAAKKT